MRTSPSLAVSGICTRFRDLGGKWGENDLVLSTLSAMSNIDSADNIDSDGGCHVRLSRDETPGSAPVFVHEHVEGPRPPG